MSIFVKGKKVDMLVVYTQKTMLGFLVQYFSNFKKTKVFWGNTCQIWSKFGSELLKGELLKIKRQHSFIFIYFRSG